MCQVRHLAMAAILEYLCLLASPVFGEPYSNVASVLELGMSARPLAMGGAFVGLADDGNALGFNPAGLWDLHGLVVLSSGEVRPGFGVLGQLGVVLPSLGIGLQYFDFGEAPETDEHGNTVGSFGYRAYTFVVGAGVRARALGLQAIPVIRGLGLGIKAKYHVINSLEPGSGRGLALDSSLHYTSGQPGRGDASPARFGFGLVMENLVGVPFKYGSGHVEEWQRGITVGMSAVLFNSWTLVGDVVAGKGIRLGLEWSPIPMLAVRLGVRGEGEVIWSLGLGVRYGMFALDYAVVVHLYLPPQHRVSFALDLLGGRGR